MHEDEMLAMEGKCFLSKGNIFWYHEYDQMGKIQKLCNRIVISYTVVATAPILSVTIENNKVDFL